MFGPSITCYEYASYVSHNFRARLPSLGVGHARCYAYLKKMEDVHESSPTKDGKKDKRNT